jgi:septum formation protein
MNIIKQSGYHIILASQSPRRQQLLKEAGLDFEIRILEYNETFPAGLDGEKIARHVSSGKASLFKGKLFVNDIVITADTIVWCNNKVLGKPADKEEAKEILREISGNTHEVITGVTIMSSSKELTFSESTKVTFDKFSEADMEYYIENFKPYDKAGAYGIQEWIGIVACSNIEGSYFNVVGLPVQRLLKELNLFVDQILVC